MKKFILAAMMATLTFPVLTACGPAPIERDDDDRDDDRDDDD